MSYPQDGSVPGCKEAEGRVRRQVRKVSTGET